MPIHATCPSCGFIGKVPETSQGHRAKCKKCGKRFKIGTVPEVEPIDVVPANPFASFSSLPRVSNQAHKPPEPPLIVNPFAGIPLFEKKENIAPETFNVVPEATYDIPAPKEPWFYGFVELIAYVIIGIAAITEISVVILASMALFSEINEGKPLGDAFRSAAVTLTPTLFVVGSVFSVCTVLLLIDIGRSLRSIK